MIEFRQYFPAILSNIFLRNIGKSKFLRIFLLVVLARHEGIFYDFFPFWTVTLTSASKLFLLFQRNQRQFHVNRYGLIYIVL